MIYNPSIPQEMAADHLRRNPEAALFMGCGLGKTAVALHVGAEFINDFACEGILVVAPLRVCNLTWPAEMKKWDSLSWMKIANLRTKAGWEALQRREAQVYVINYEMLQQFADKYLKGRRRAQYAFDTIIWDEITRAKNYKSKRIKAVLPYFRDTCRRHWGLTGTPAPNGLLDLFGQMKVLDGGTRLGKSYTMFKETYFFPTDFMRYNWIPKPDGRDRIYKRLEGFALTLKSSEWLKIPDVNVEDIDVSMPKEARAKYDELEKELFVFLDSKRAGPSTRKMDTFSRVYDQAAGEQEYVIAQNAAVLVNKLLQVSSGAVYIEDGSWRQLHDAKHEAFTTLVKQLKGKPTIVACQYRHEQERIRASHLDAVFFQDAKDEVSQAALVEKWNAGKIPLLVSNPQSMGHGLNLQGGGSTILWYTLPWSRELYDQMNARVARLGQECVTTIYRILVTDTVDWAVADALRRKDEEQSALLDALKQWKDSKLQK